MRPSILQRPLGRAALFLSVFLCLVASALFLSPSAAQAAEKGDRLTFINNDYGDVGPYDADRFGCYQVSGNNGASGVAYCMDGAKPGPGSGGMSFVCEGRTGDVALSYLIAKGYPNTTTIRGTSLSAGEARAVTQMAIWHLRGYDTGGLTSPRLKSLADAFASEAQSFAAGGGKLASAATVWYADGDHQRILLMGSPFGSLTVSKSSSSPQVSSGNPCYSLEGAVFGVYTDKACTSLAAKLTLNSAGTASVGELAPGTYYVKEISAPKGFKLNTTSVAVTVEAGKTAGCSVKDEPVADLSWRLVRKAGQDSDGSDLGGTLFAVKHYGNVSGSTGGSPLRSWVFSSAPDGSVAFDSVHLQSGDALYKDASGKAALPLGTYSIQEVQAPSGYRLSDGEVHVAVLKHDGAGKAVWEKVGNWGELGSGDAFAGKSVYDLRLPTVATTLTESDDHLSPSVGKVELVDSVACKWLLVGHEYRLEGELMDAESGESLGVVSELAFTAEEADEVHELVFEVDASTMAGTTAVCFETLYEDGEEIARHADLADEGQTVRFPAIGTELTDAEGLHETLATEPLKLTDTVTYENLEPGREYVMTGVLHDGDTGEPLGPRAQASFTPEERRGTVEVVFEFPGELVRGRKVVAFEDLSHEGRTFAVHADLEDEDQLVRVPGLATRALDKSDQDGTIFPEKGQTVVDHVDCTALVPGEEYRIEGILVDKVEGRILSPAEDGEEQVVSAVFTAGDDGCASVELEFQLDGTGLEGHALIAFERLYHENRLVAVHEDLEDEDQTVYVPKIGTVLTDRNALKSFPASELTTIVDTIAYEGLKPGVVYTVSGTLMDPSTGAPLSDASGRALTAQTQFTPQESSGTTEVVFEVPGEALAGRSAVAFERISHDGVAVAAHEDLSSKEQTVFVENTPTPRTGEVAGPPLAAMAGAGAAAVAGAALLRTAASRKDRRRLR